METEAYRYQLVVSILVSSIIILISEAFGHIKVTLLIGASKKVILSGATILISPG